MNKTDTLLYLMRAHEAVRKLPDDANINGVDVTLYKTDGNKINVFLNGEAEIRNIVSKTVKHYTGCNSGRVKVSDSYGVDYWWGVDFDEDGHIISRA